MYIIGVWESEELVRARRGSREFKETLTSVQLGPPHRAPLTSKFLRFTQRSPARTNLMQGRAPDVPEISAVRGVGRHTFTAAVVE